MTLIKRLFGTSASRTSADVNMVTVFERRRFAKTMTGETAVASAVRLGCIAG